MPPIFRKKFWRAVRRGDWAANSSWKYRVWFVFELIARMLGQFNAFRVTQRAAGVAFFTAVAFIPSLMLLVILADQVNLLTSASNAIVDALLENYIPVEKQQIMISVEKWVTNARESGAGTLGLIIAFLAALNLFTGFYELINDLWHVPRHGGGLHRFSRFLLLILIAPPLIAVSTSISTVFSMGFLTDIPRLTSLISRATPLILTFMLAFVGLKVLPRRDVETKYAAIAALTCAIAFEITKYGFGVYVSNIIRGSWMPIYGAIFILPVFLIWNFVVAIVVAGTSSIAFLLQTWEHEGPERKSAHALFVEEQARIEERRQRRLAERQERLRDLKKIEEREENEAEQ